MFLYILLSTNRIHHYHFYINMPLCILLNCWKWNHKFKDHCYTTSSWTTKLQSRNEDKDFLRQKFMQQDLRSNWVLNIEPLTKPSSQEIYYFLSQSCLSLLIVICYLFFNNVKLIVYLTITVVDFEWLNGCFELML